MPHRVVVRHGRDTHTLELSEPNFLFTELSRHLDVPRSRLSVVTKGGKRITPSNEHTLESIELVAECLRNGKLTAIGTSEKPPSEPVWDRMTRMFSFCRRNHPQSDEDPSSAVGQSINGTNASYLQIICELPRFLWLFVSSAIMAER